MTGKTIIKTIQKVHKLSAKDIANGQRFAGVALVLISALVFSSAGLFVKGVEAGAWSVIFWRGVFAAIFTTGYVVMRGHFKREFLQMGKPGWSAAIVGASGTAAFIPAFKFTTIANVTLIYAAAPLVAALIMWLWIREKPALAVTLASLAAFGGVLVIVSGSVGGTHLTGDLLAIWMTIAMAFYLCIYRRFPETPAAGPAVVSSLVLLPFCLWFEPNLMGPIPEVLIMGAFGLVFAIASVTLAEGARRLPAGETALLGALEIPVALLWAYLLFAEVPALMTYIGGAIIIVAVFLSQWFGRRATGELRGQATI